MKYYVYRHIRLDKNEVFYIGKGSGNRAFDTFHRTTHWKRIVNKAGYEVDILFESDNHDFILKKEIEFIAFYGRRDLGLGQLINKTYGGDGFTGQIISKEHRRKIAAANRGRILTKEHRDKISKTLTGKYYQTKETIEKCRQRMIGNKICLGRKPSPESIEKRVSKMRGRKRTPEQIERAAAGHRGKPSKLRGRKMPESQKINIGLANKGHKYHTEEQKKATSKRMKGKAAWNKGIPCSEEQKARISQTMTGVKLTPERAEKHRQNLAKIRMLRKSHSAH